MNLFGKIFLRKLKSTEAYEKEKNDLLHSYERYVAIEKSQLLRDYKALRKEVKSAAFKENKKVLINRKFKDTEEYRNWVKYNKLNGNHKLHRYYMIAVSKELDAFLSFKETPEYEFVGNKIELKKSETLRKYRAFEKSKDYKIYTRFHDSYIVKEYERLKQVVSSKEFIQFKEFWSDPHRWTKTEACHKEQKFRELSQHTDIVFYNHTDSASFEFYQNWKLVFNDEFNGVSLDRSLWDTGYYFSNPAFIRDYSLTRYKQSNNGGKNVSEAHGCMIIETLREKNEARAWDEKLGFVQHTFPYTSDVINAGASCKFTEGIVEVKLRAKSGVITHVFSLVSENRVPQINIYHFDGKHVTVGNVWKGGNQSEKVKGISPRDFYIYKLEWTDNELIWSVNNLEIFRTRKGVPPIPLFPIFASIVDGHQDDTGVLEVDWVRIYQKK